MFAVHKILHPTDFGLQAARAFEAACDLAHKYKADLVLLHVTAPMVIYGEMDSDLLRDRITSEQAAQQLESISALEPSLKIDRRVSEGEPSYEIVQTAKDKGCDLIVVGSHGRRGLARLLLGSVAKSVLRDAACPVLVVNDKVAEPGSEPAKVGKEVSDQNGEPAPFLDELLHVLKVHARETKRLVEHVERHTGPLTEPSEMALVVSELSALQAGLSRTPLRSQH